MGGRAAILSLLLLLLFVTLAHAAQPLLPVMNDDNSTRFAPLSSRPRSSRSPVSHPSSSEHAGESHTQSLDLPRLGNQRLGGKIEPREQGPRPEHPPTLFIPMHFNPSGPPRQLLGSALHVIELGGSIRGLGYYYVVAHLGTPPQRFTLIVDTGSTMTYVPCKGCGQSCGSHTDPRFNPELSSTYRGVPCGGSECAATASSRCVGARCTYYRHYAEQSSTSGVVATDVLRIGGYLVLPGFVFGCETQEGGDIYSQEADGILGLGKDSVSLPTQLAKQRSHDDLFAICFGGFAGGGGIIFGGSGNVTLPGAQPLQWTRLLHNRRHSNYYLVNCTGMTLGGQLLKVPPDSFRVGYGTVLDSGSTFSYVPTLVFNVLTRHLLLAVKLPQVPGPDPSFKDICFSNASKDFGQLHNQFPQLSMRFKGGAELNLAPVNYLFQFPGHRGSYCFGFFDGKDRGTVIGGLAMRNKLVVYDRQHKRVGFTAADCDHINYLQ
eukprot:jgi/Mesvir1/27521/Mv07283-RA.1